MIGNGHTMGVTAEIAQYLQRPTEGLLGIDDPVVAVQAADEFCELLATEDRVFAAECPTSRFSRRGIAAHSLLIAGSLKSRFCRLSSLTSGPRVTDFHSRRARQYGSDWGSV